MEEKLYSDIGEEIIARLKKLQSIINEKLQEENEKDLQDTSKIRL